MGVQTMMMIQQGFLEIFLQPVQVRLAASLLVGVIIEVISAKFESFISSSSIFALCLVCFFALKGIIAAQKQKKRNCSTNTVS